MAHTRSCRRGKRDTSNLLPFQFLKNPELGSYLEEKFEISYVPSATIPAGSPAFPTSQMAAYSQ
jgi:hypothetical protein